MTRERPHGPLTPGWPTNREAKWRLQADFRARYRLQQRACVVFWEDAFERHWPGALAEASATLSRAQDRCDAPSPLHVRTAASRALSGALCGSLRSKLLALELKLRTVRQIPGISVLIPHYGESILVPGRFRLDMDAVSVRGYLIASKLRHMVSHINTPHPPRKRTNILPSHFVQQPSPVACMSYPKPPNPQTLSQRAPLIFVQPASHFPASTQICSIPCFNEDANSPHTNNAPFPLQKLHRCCHLLHKPLANCTPQSTGPQHVRTKRPLAPISSH